MNVNVKDIVWLLDAATQPLGYILLMVIAALAIPGLVSIAVEWIEHRGDAERERLRMEQQHQWNMATLMFQQTALIVELERMRSGR